MSIASDAIAAAAGGLTDRLTDRLPAATRERTRGAGYGDVVVLGRRRGRRRARAEDLLQDPRGPAQAAVREDPLPLRAALQPRRRRQDRLRDDRGVFEGETGGAGLHTFNTKFQQRYAVCSCEAAWHWEWEPDA